MPRLQLALLTCVLALALPAGAQAGFFGADTIDGPNADVSRVGGVDVARDGTATLVYLKRVAGLEHVFAARMVDGAWQPPERLDPLLALPSSDAVVGVANDGAATVAFVNNGQLYTIVRRAKDAAWPAPVALGDGAAATPSVDLSVNGVGYVVWTSNGDVLGAMLPRTATAYQPLPAPLDVTPATEAGTGTGRPRVTAAADGTALAAWGEGGHVYARRLLRETLSAFPQELGVADLEGHPGGTADLPEVDSADDSSFAWVTFREAFDNGATTRVLARRLVGSTFDPPVAVGAGFGAEPGTAPTLDVAGIGDAVFASESATSHTPFAALNYIDVLGAPFAVSAGNSVASNPAVAIGETSQAAVAWFDTDSGVPAVDAASFKFREPADPETSLTDLTLGAVDPNGGLDAAADKYGDAVIAFTQGVSPTRRIVAAVWDRPPANLIQTTTFKWRDDTAPVGWAPISEPWGDIVWTVSVDGTVLGTTAKRRFPIQGRVGDGLHQWTLTATDRRGQKRTAGPRSLRIDSSGPRLAVAVRGHGASRRIVITASDPSSGLERVRTDFGDGSPAAFGRVVRHRFRRGSWTVKVTATDEVGNTSSVSRRVTVG